MTQLNPFCPPEDRRFLVKIQLSGVTSIDGYLPELPRKGDILWLRSLCKYDDSLPAEVVVSKVEWALIQQSDTIQYWVTVRRTKASSKNQ